MTHNARLAQMLAESGLAVFPCGPDKRPLCKWKEASTSDPQMIDAMWRANPDAPPGVDCGKSAIAVIDVDCHEGGENGREKFAALEAMHGRIDDAPRVRTPSGGFHLYFKQPVDGVITNSRGMLPSGIDVRGAGGYVLAAGAMLPDGRKYETEPGSRRLSDALANGGLKPLDGWLLELIRPTAKHEEQASPRRDTSGNAYAQAALDRECEVVAKAPKGQRNEQLNRSAFSLGQLVGGGELSEQEVVEALLVAAGEAGLPRIEAIKTINSGLEKGQGQPRQRPDDGHSRQARDWTANGAATPDASASEKPRVLVDNVNPEKTVESLTGVFAASGQIFDRGLPVRVIFDPVRGGMVAEEMNADAVAHHAHKLARPFARRPNKEGIFEEVDARFRNGPRLCICPPKANGN